MTTQQHTGNAGTGRAYLVMPQIYRVMPKPARRKRLEAALNGMSLQPQYRGKFGAEDDLTGVFNPTRWLELFYYQWDIYLDFDAFADWYWAMFGQSLQYDKNALRARLYRTQLGYLTELHTVYLIAEQGHTVYRGPLLETRGVDAELKLPWGVVNLHIFVDTERAWQKLVEKLRHKRAGAAAGRHFYLAYPIGGAPSVMRTLQGGIQVFQPNALQQILQQHLHPQMETHTVYPQKRRVWLAQAGVVK